MGLYNSEKISDGLQYFLSVLVFDNMNEEETADTLVIVFIAETDPDAVFQVSVPCFLIRDEDPDPVLFSLDPDSVLFSLDPDPDTNCNNGFIKRLSNSIIK